MDKIEVDDIEREIAYEYYATGDLFFRLITPIVGPAAFEADRPLESLRLTTICILVLRNGFKVVGDSACVSPVNFDAEKGRKIAREKAIQQLWPILGYSLREKLHEAARVHTHGPSRTKEGI